ncbi:hypothetical protein BH23BAC2_BH23BAC2_16200 [soil metagenome]
MEGILKDNIKDNSFLRIKSGILGVKMDADELELGINDEKKIAAQKKELTPEEKEKKEEEALKNLKSLANARVKTLLNTMFWHEKPTLDIFEKSNKYKFEVEGYTQMGNDIVYILSFEPKSGSSFKGKICVNTMDYGVHRIDYFNMKPLKKFRLLGINTADDVYRGKMIFSRNEVTGKYDPVYIEREKGESFGLDRPLSIIEKNKFVTGKRKQNELDLDIKINFGQLNKLQLVVYENELIDETVYTSAKQIEAFDYKTFKLYDPEFWTGYNIIEPNAAIKAFTAPQEKSLL